MNQVPDLTPQKYFRLPWSMTDNAISWLEVTTACNLACEGCYRPNEPKGHKTLKQIAEELAVFKKYRNSDCISIAGGDPLVHPQIEDIVRMIKDGGWKPILNTNGLALTPEFLRELKKAGVYGFTFHIDTTQKRHDSKDAGKEADHNHLRQHFAEMLAEVGGIGCSFNQTVSENTLDQIPEVIRWARQYPDIVHTMVFIMFRSPEILEGEFDYYVGGEKIQMDRYKESQWAGQRMIKSKDVVAKIREVESDFEPNAYLGGTADPQSTKWLLATRICNKERTFGYGGARLMELAQNGHHLFTGKWLSYANPRTVGMGKTLSFLFSIVDKGARRALGQQLLSWIKNPLNLFKTTYMQTFTVIQPIDMMADGQQNMCDSCPDITVHNGQLYWSCRLEEIKKYGTFVTAVPKKLHVVKEEPQKVAANQ